MGKNKGVKANLKPNNEEKVVTKYDLKMQRRREEQKREKRARLITRCVVFTILAAVVIVSAVAGFLKYNRIFNKYIVVDNESVNKIEFDFYYGLNKNSQLNTTLFGDMTYADYYTQYLGYDLNKDDSKQTYSEEKTWYDYFAESAVDKIVNSVALNKIADEKNFEYDVTEDYNNFIQDMKDAAKEADKSYSSYIKLVFGKYASEKRIEKYLKEYLRAGAYSEVLIEELACTDEEYQAEYEENKNSYDQFTYRIFTFTADAEDKDGYEKAKSDANAFAGAVDSEKAFIEQCIVYQPEGETKYSDNEETSLEKGVLLDEAETVCQEWLGNADRKEGDVNVFEDEENNSCYVIYFVSRSYDGSADTSIKDIVLNRKYSEYIEKYTDEIKVDTLGYFDYGVEE